MLKKNEILVTPFSKQSYIMESDKDRYSNFIISRTEANQNVHGTDIEQRKELKRQNPY
jgi:hypothetical protein